MADMSGRKVFKVFNQDFIVDERYTVTKELGQGAYGIVWYELYVQPAAQYVSSFVPSKQFYGGLTHMWVVPQRTIKLEKGSRSRRSPMSSARKS